MIPKLSSQRDALSKQLENLRIDWNDSSRLLDNARKKVKKYESQCDLKKDEIYEIERQINKLDEAINNIKRIEYTEEYKTVVEVLKSNEEVINI